MGSVCAQGTSFGVTRQSANRIGLVAGFSRRVYGPVDFAPTVVGVSGSWGLCSGLDRGRSAFSPRQPHLRILPDSGRRPDCAVGFDSRAEGYYRGSGVPERVS